MDAARHQALRARNDEIVRLYEVEKLSMQAVGRRVGLSTSGVEHFLRDVGIPRCPVGKLNPEKHAQIRIARAAGEDLRSIAARFGVSKQMISSICRGRSSPRRPVSTLTSAG